MQILDIPHYSIGEQTKLLKYLNEEKFDLVHFTQFNHPVRYRGKFVVTIHEAEARKQNFGQVRNAFVRVYDPSTNEEILKYDLGEDYSIETAVEFGSLYLKDGQWKFKAIGAGFAGGLQKFVDKFI